MSKFKVTFKRVYEFEEDEVFERAGLDFKPDMPTDLTDEQLLSSAKRLGWDLLYGEIDYFTDMLEDFMGVSVKVSNRNNEVDIKITGNVVKDEYGNPTFCTGVIL